MAEIQLSGHLSWVEIGDGSIPVDQMGGRTSIYHIFLVFFSPGVSHLLIRTCPSPFLGQPFVAISVGFFKIHLTRSNQQRSLAGHLRFVLSDLGVPSY